MFIYGNYELAIDIRWYYVRKNMIYKVMWKNMHDACDGGYLKLLQYLLTTYGKYLYANQFQDCNVGLDVARRKGYEDIVQFIMHRKEARKNFNFCKCIVKMLVTFICFMFLHEN